MRYYQDDPMVRHPLGVKHLPDVATISRTLAVQSLQNVTRLPGGE
jgi:hypothetical protein